MTWKATKEKKPSKRKPKHIITTMLVLGILSAFFLVVGRTVNKMDVMMPVMDGYQTVGRIRAMDRKMQKKFRS